MSLSIIAGMTKDRVIGLDNDIPWHISEDLKNFKYKTMGHHIVMGRKTYESIGKPLPGRTNIVISSTMKTIEGITVVKDLGEALDIIENTPLESFIIGGQRVYEDTIDTADKLYLSIIKKYYEGNKFFPEFGEEDWRIEQYQEYNEFTFIQYNRR